MSPTSKSQLKPFFLASGAWAVMGLLWCVLPWSDQAVTSGGWFLLFWGLSMLDLGVISGLVLSIGAWEGVRDRARLGLRVGILVFLKLAVLTIFGLILFLKHGIPQPSLLLGLGTLIVVPLIGGLAWSYQTGSTDRGHR